MDDDCFVPAQLGLDFGPALRLLAAHGCERAVYETGGVGLDCHAPIIRLVGWAGNGTLGLLLGPSVVPDVLAVPAPIFLVSLDLRQIEADVSPVHVAANGTQFKLRVVQGRVVLHPRPHLFVHALQ